LLAAVRGLTRHPIRHLFRSTHQKEAGCNAPGLQGGARKRIRDNRFEEERLHILRCTERYRPTTSDGPRNGFMFLPPELVLIRGLPAPAEFILEAAIAPIKMPLRDMFPGGI